MDLILLRFLFVVLLATVCYFLHPFGIHNGWLASLAGVAAAGAVIVFELRVRALTLRRLIGAVAGSVLGIFGAALFCLVLRTAPLAREDSSVLQIFVLLLMTYVGLLVGANKGDLLNPAALGTIFATDRPTRRSSKVLDTSVIIDGRIADIAEAGFIDGIMVVPEFVLRELQVVADSTDGSKRQRGRRGRTAPALLRDFIIIGRSKCSNLLYVSELLTSPLVRRFFCCSYSIHLSACNPWQSSRSSLRYRTPTFLLYTHPIYRHLLHEPLDLNLPKSRFT